MNGLAWQSSSVTQAMVQMVGLVMMVRSSGDTSRQESDAWQSDELAQGSAKMLG